LKIFFDSSAFAKRYIEEPGSALVEKICSQASQLAVSILCIPEILSALNRRVREKRINPDDYRTAEDRLLEEVEDAVLLNITPAVVMESIRLLEGNQLRTMDALHVACAMMWETDLFVSSDQKQIQAARKSGLPVRTV